MCLVVLLLAVTAVVATGGRHLMPGLRVHVELERLGIVTPGMSVRVSGRTIGDVEDVHLLPPRAESSARVSADLWIDKKHAWLVRRNSEVFINQQYVLGEANVEIGATRGEPGPPLQDGESIRGIDPPRLESLMPKFYSNMALIKENLLELPETHELAAAWGELGGAALAIQAKHPDAWPRLFASGSKLVDEMGQAQLFLSAAGVSPDQLGHEWDAATAVLAQARASGVALSGRLRQVTRNVDRVRGTLQGDSLAQAERTFEDAQRVGDRVSTLLGGVSAMLHRIQRGQGTLGALLNDIELADDIKDLMRGLKQRPWETVAKTSRDGR